MRHGYVVWCQAVQLCVHMRVYGVIIVVKWVFILCCTRVLRYLLVSVRVERDRLIGVQIWVEMLDL